MSTVSQPDGIPLAEIRRHATSAAGMMKTLGNESRLLILCALAEAEQSVGQLNDVVPLSQSALSQHLARLRDEELVTTRRESQTIFYSLAPGPVYQIIQLLHDLYCGSDSLGSDSPGS